MPANSEPLHEASDRHNYYYRRSLTVRDYLPALAIGVGAGLFAFYLATRFAQRTPLLPDGDPAALPPRRRRVKGSAG
jgi:hypothetical protein